MVKQKKDIPDTGEVKDEGDKTGNSIEELMEKVKSQDEMLIEMSKANSQITETLKATQSKNNELSEQMQNLTNILGNLAERSGSDYDGDIDTTDYTDKAKVEEMVNKIAEEKIALLEKKKTENQTAKDKAFMDGYRETVSDMLDDEENPKGDPFTAKERKEILSMLVDNPEFNKIKGVNAPKEARKNFKAAYKRYYGLDRKNPFHLSESPEGTGVGGEFKGGGSVKKTYAFSRESLKQLERAGISQDEAEKLMKKREERELLV